MEPWQILLAHAKAVRNALIACGNPAPTRPDPHGGLVNVSMRRFNGTIFWKSMEEQGHNASTPDKCKCRLN
jgi:hypothetical protein